MRNKLLLFTHLLRKPAFITPAKEAMFLPLSVCLSAGYLKKLSTNLTNFFKGVGYVTSGEILMIRVIIRIMNS